MKRAMAELRSAEPKDEAADAAATWLERIGEKLGDCPGGRAGQVSSLTVVSRGRWYGLRR